MSRMHIRLPQFLVYSCTLLFCIFLFWNFIFPMAFPHLFKKTPPDLRKLPINLRAITHRPVKKLPLLKFGSVFDGFNNVTGTKDGELIVPNIIHYIHLGKSNISFVEAVCILSAFKNHKPGMIMFHTDVISFIGPYWKKVKTTPGLVYKINRIQMPKKIFGKQISKTFFKLHATEFTKIKVLMQFGGIVLDNDIYVVKSLNYFRKFEMALGWEEGACLSTRVLIAHKEARFLKLWLESFHEYFPRKWYYNAGCKPTEEILEVKPELVHREKKLFGLRSMSRQLYTTWNWQDWKNFYTFPLLMRHSSLTQFTYKWLPKFDDKNIRYYPLAFGVMARDVYSLQ